MNFLVSHRGLLRLEGAAVGVISVLLYASTSASWWLFAGALFAPDLAMIGYGGGPRLGAALYNAAHFYVLPLLLGGAGLVTSIPLLIALALIWTTHIGVDRALGYGFKHPSGFHDTHLGPIGSS